MSYSSRMAEQIINTPQAEPIPGREQDMSLNHTGSYTFEIDKWTRLRRFLILGSEGGTYYQKEGNLTRENATCVLECAAEDHERTVKEIVEVSDQALGVKNETCVFALALVAKLGDDKARKLAYGYMPKVCRIPTDLYNFLSVCKALGGFGRGMRNSVAGWFHSRDNKQLAFHATKYRQRNGWSMRDVLRKAHVEPRDDEQRTIFGYICGHDAAFEKVKTMDTEAGAYLRAIHALPTMKPREIAEVMRTYKLPMEVIPTEKRKGEVWEAFLEVAGMTALMRNVRNLAKKEVLSLSRPGMMKLFRDRMTNEEAIRKGRLHPISLLQAAAVLKEDSTEEVKRVLPEVQNILDDAMMLAFKQAVPTGKRYMLALDVSGSMTWDNCSGLKITPSVACMAMALYTLRAEEPLSASMWAFSNTFRRMNITEKTPLADAIRTAEQMSFGSTNCSLPMKHAIKLKLPVDVFVVYTDSETNHHGSAHPAQLIKEYRQKMGIPAKLVVFGATATKCSIADPKDPGMLDVAGLDASGPRLLSAFASM